MKVFYLSGVAESIRAIKSLDQARIGRTKEFFEKYGFQIGPKYIKKITKSGIWELRAGKIRLFLYIRGKKAIGVHVIYKKSKKLPLKDIKLAERRVREL